MNERFLIFIPLVLSMFPIIIQFFVSEHRKKTRLIFIAWLFLMVQLAVILVMITGNPQIISGK